MALNVSDVVSTESNFFSSFLQSMPPYLSDKLALIFDIGRILLIIVIIYFIIKIIVHFFKLRDSSNLAKIAKSVDDINKKMEILLEKNKVTKKPKK